MLNIENLYISTDNKEILKGFNIDIQPGEIHAIMGPNGTGKSTLSHVLAGKSGYEITSGKIFFKGEDIADLSIDERARKGLFLAFQYPVEIAGVTIMNFLKIAINSHRKAKGEKELDGVKLLRLVQEKAKIVGMDDTMLKRSVNQGFSGGEKKRFEALQMLLLEPDFAILDETDSGLDIDALKTVAAAVNSLRDGKRSMLVITHYQRLLNYIIPDKVHVMDNGKIIASGGIEMAEKLEAGGYDAFQ